MIYYFTPYIKSNLGMAYNHYCELVPDDDDWITFIDGDIMLLLMDWGEIWQKIIDNNPNAGIISAITNRVFPTYQKVQNMENERDISIHRNFAQERFDTYQYSVTPAPQNNISGFFFSFKKSTWKKIGGFDDGILTVDWKFSNKVKKLQLPLLVAEGFYVLHYYRLNEGSRYTTHLCSGITPR